MTINSHTTNTTVKSPAKLKSVPDTIPAGWTGSGATDTEVTKHLDNVLPALESLRSQAGRLSGWGTELANRCQSLIAAADLAMYRAKQFGSGIEFASVSDNPHDFGRVGLLADLSGAIGTDQIVAHYQPMVRLSDGTVESVEALIRWTHPEFGPIAPGEFIAMTEQTDLIGPLTDSILQSAIHDLLTLGPNLPKLCLNVAARNLQDRQFATRVIDTMHELGFPPERLEIEITERDIVTNSERSALALARLRDHGVRIAIDDFGTGYASFLTLRELRADRLKIDQQFTSNMVESGADELIVVSDIYDHPTRLRSFEMIAEAGR